MEQAIKMRAAKFAFIALSILILFTLGFSAPLQAADDDNFLDLQNAHRAVWKIYGRNTKLGKTSVGTAFAIGPDRFVTNAHVLRALRGVSIRDIRLSQEGSSHRLRIDRLLRLSELYDLALFRTTENVTNYLGPADDFSHEFKQLSLLGYPAGSFRRFSQAAEVTYISSSIGLCLQLKLDSKTSQCLVESVVGLS